MGEELEWVQQAIYTEPNDQSIWLYHHWLTILGRGHDRLRITHCAVLQGELFVFFSGPACVRSLDASDAPVTVSMCTGKETSQEISPLRIGLIMQSRAEYIHIYIHICSRVHGLAVAFLDAHPIWPQVRARQDGTLIQCGMYDTYIFRLYWMILVHIPRPTMEAAFVRCHNFSTNTFGTCTIVVLLSTHPGLVSSRASTNLNI